MDNGSKYIFLLIGKTGSGKSATGNSILGEKYFVSSDKGVSVTKNISVKTVTRHALSVTAIDAPGVMDTSVKSDEVKYKSCTEMTAAMSHCPTDGKLAIVLVLKYGERFTEENRLTMYILKNIFGDKDLWKSCIIILTHGDLFKINNEDDVSFESWLRDQEDELGELFKDCSYRCVLFNNRTKSPQESDQQFLDLLKLTEQLDHNYTMTKFDEAKKRQNRLMLEEKLPQAIKVFDKKIKILFFSASQFSVKDRMYDSFINSMNELNEELNQLDSSDNIYYEEGEPLLLHEQRREVSRLEQEVETRVSLNKLDMQANKLKNKPAPYQNEWRLSVVKLDLPVQHLAANISNSPELYIYQDRLLSLQSKLKELRLVMQRHDVIRSYEIKIQKLTSELNAIPIPSELHKFSPYFVEANKFHTEVIKLNREIRGLEALISKVDNLRKRIQYKLEDSSATSGWNRTSVVTGALSIGTVFIPAVGIPLAIGLNVVPLIGRVIHRGVLKYKNY